MQNRRTKNLLRSDFDRIYDSRILNAGFTESNEYYIADKERYWRSLQLFSQLSVPHPSKILEIGGGQMAILCKFLFGDDCAVGDVSSEFFGPVEKQGIHCIECNLMEDEFDAAHEQFDVVLLLEVIEHLPVPAYVIFEKLKTFLKPGGILFLTTPNLFRLRNMFRMILGVEFLDRFMLPEPNQGLGHQLEYSANQMQWQIERAALNAVLLEHDELGRVGHSPKARLARKLLSPLTLRPIWRDGLVAAAQKEGGPPYTEISDTDKNWQALYEHAPYHSD